MGKTVKIFLLTIIILIIISCDLTKRSDKTISNEVIFRIDSVVYREGVFKRRYAIGSHPDHLTKKDLKNYIDKQIKTELLLVKAAYDKGLDRKSEFRKRMNRYKMDLFEKYHPIYRQKVNINEKVLDKYYESKKRIYTLDLLNSRSYKIADSLRIEYLDNGLDFAKYARDRKQPGKRMFPVLRKYKKIEYGTQLPLEVFKEIKDLKPGDISKPINLGPVWGIIKIEKIERNNKLKDLAKIKASLEKEMARYYRIQAADDLVENLKQKYNVVKKDVNTAEIVDLYNRKTGYFSLPDKEKNYLIYDANQFRITLLDIIEYYNNLNVMMVRPLILNEKDLNVLFKTVINKKLLYLDAIERKVNEIPIIQDKIINKKQIVLRNNLLKNHIARVDTKITEEEMRAIYEENEYSADFDKMTRKLKSEVYKKRTEEKKEKLIKKYERNSQIVYNDKLLEKYAKYFSNN